MPREIPVHAAIRNQLRDSAVHALGLNDRLGSLIAVKPRQPSGVFHGKIDFSQPPWHSPVAICFLDMHALSRKIERDFRHELNLPVRYRGSSDANTRKALHASIDLAQTAEDYVVRLETRDLEKWSRRASIALGETEVPRRLPRMAGKPEAKCPFCRNTTLRMCPFDMDGHGEVRCVNPKCKDEEGRKPSARMEFSKLAGDWVIVWQDGVAGVPL